MEKDIPSNTSQKKARLATLISDSRFQSKEYYRAQRGSTYNIKGSIQEANRTLLNVCALNNRTSNTCQNG